MSKLSTDLMEAERKRRQLAEDADAARSAGDDKAGFDDPQLRARIQAEQRAAIESDPWKRTALDNGGVGADPLASTRGAERRRAEKAIAEREAARLVAAGLQARQVADRTAANRIEAELAAAKEDDARRRALADIELKTRIEADHRAGAVSRQREFAERRELAEATAASLRQAEAERAATEAGCARAAAEERERAAQAACAEAEPEHAQAEVAAKRGAAEAEAIRCAEEKACLELEVEAAVAKRIENEREAGSRALRRDTPDTGAAGQSRRLDAWRLLAATAVALAAGIGTGAWLSKPPAAPSHPGSNEQGVLRLRLEDKLMNPLRDEDRIIPRDRSR